MQFEGLDTRVERIKAACQSNRVVQLGGGNYSEKKDALMAIKGSGSWLSRLTPADMSVIRMQDIAQAIDFPYDANPKVRESRYKEFLLAARISADMLRPSVETAVHCLLPRFVLHTHPTVLTALSCTEQARELAAKHLGPKYITMDYLDPGISLGIEAKRLLAGYDGIPLGMMQRNHNVFFASDDFDALLKEHDRVIARVTEEIQNLYGFKNMDIDPFGSRATKDKFPQESQQTIVMKALYDKLFQEDSGKASLTRTVIDSNLNCLAMQGSKGTLYFDTGNLALDYSLSQMAHDVGEKFARLAPDHLVSCNMYSHLLNLSDPTSPERVSQDMEKVKPSKDGLLPRVYIVPGMGIITAGGHIACDREPEARARNAMVMAYDALLVTVYALALGNIRRLNEEQAHFIETWEVEHARAALMEKG